MSRLRTRRLGVACALFALWSSAAGAAGAIAVGVADGVARHGFSFGMNSGKTDETVAAQDALNGCKASKESNDKARARCKTIGTFTDQCAAIAMDPKDGTPGVGWAIAADVASASSQALASCKATAGPGRDGFCKVSSTRCDGTAH
jgi:hypothetical protein